jgi:hypothetical protein
MPDPEEVLTRARIHAELLVGPALVPIYERPGGSDLATRQIGTGFRLNCAGRPALVTARHTLYGEHYNRDPEDPFEKHIVFDGRLRGLFELRSGEVAYSESDDLAALFVDEMGLVGTLPMTCLLHAETTCSLVSIYGFLMRDFVRRLAIGLLSPKPYFYTNQRLHWGRGYTGILYPSKCKNRDARTGKRVQAPSPRGLSGGPMLDTLKLAFGTVNIVGVFTESRQSENGRAFGESAPKAVALLRQLCIAGR